MGLVIDPLIGLDLLLGCWAWLEVSLLNQLSCEGKNLLGLELIFAGSGITSDLPHQKRGDRRQASRRGSHTVSLLTVCQQTFRYFSVHFWVGLLSQLSQDEVLY